MQSFVVGISGASGFILGVKTVKALLLKGHFVDLIITNAAMKTASEELAKHWNGDRVLENFSADVRDRIVFHDVQNIGARCASGSYKSDGMIIIPCSMATLAAIALGLSDNLLRRAADVAIKERRRLVVVPREMPLSSIHLDHMSSLARLGVSILPPQPAWYQRPKTIEDVEDFFVARALEQLGVSVEFPRWQGG